MIQIGLKTGDLVTYTDDQYTTYNYDGKTFAVINGSDLLSLFNIDAITVVQIKKPEPPAPPMGMPLNFGNMMSPPAEETE